MRAVALVLANLACLSALFWMFDVPYRQFRIDLLRHHLFGVRDSLFKAAVDGQISFDSPAYGMVRQTLNGMIRFAHQVSLWQLLLMIFTERLWLDPEDETQFSERFEKARDGLTDEQSELLNSLMNCAHGVLISHMAHTSIVLLPFAVLAKVAAQALGLINVFVKKTDKSVPKPVLTMVDRHAYAIGKSAPLAEAA